jgi:hypothetical protein
VAARRAFRAGRDACRGRRRDALFELRDALLTAGPGPSLPHLRLAPGHRRGWGSVDAALRRGRVHVEALRALVRRQRLPTGPPVYAVDVRVWPRADAAASPERGSQAHAPRRRRAGGGPVVPGWASQWLVRLSPPRDSRTAPVDARRVRPQEKPTAVAVERPQALVAARPAGDAAAGPLVVSDAGDDASGFAHALAGTAGALLRRLRRNRHCWFAPDPATQPRSGRPERPGAKVVCNEPATWPAPTAACRVSDAVYGQGAGSAWAGLHPSGRRPVRPGVAGLYRGPRRLAYGTVVRRQVDRPPGRRRRPDVVWRWWQPAPGTAAPAAAERDPRATRARPERDHRWRGYCRRADLEQTFRFLKPARRWVTPRVRLPEQADRWPWLGRAASTQLRRARGAVADHRLPWERPRPPARLTPARAHRGRATLARRLPPLAAAPTPCGRSPGRPTARRRVT